MGVALKLDKVFVSFCKAISSLIFVKLKNKCIQTIVHTFVEIFYVKNAPFRLCPFVPPFESPAFMPTFVNSTRFRKTAAAHYS